MKKERQCRFCKARLDTAARECPACRSPQGWLREWIALALLLFITGFAAYPFLDDGLRLVTDAATGSEGPSGAPAYPGTARVSGPVANEKVAEAATQRLRPSATTATPYLGSLFQQDPLDFPFCVAEKRWNARSGRYDFYRRGMAGSERVIRQNARRYILSENQLDYPVPESGCGPTALLNLYIWYTKFGLVKESVRHADERLYKRLKFLEIDRKIAEIKGHSRSDSGTNSLEQVVALDEILQASSSSPIRVHFEFKNPPLNSRDFIDISRNFRAGILAVRPKDPETGDLMPPHAVLAIRGDRDGRITLANWGEYAHGRLVEKFDGQWFLPDNPAQHQLLIQKLTTLVPFTPASAE